MTGRVFRKHYELICSEHLVPCIGISFEQFLYSSEFVPAFSQKTDKTHHGRHASLNQSESKLLESWHIRNNSILFVDDGITSGTTARLCYEALVVPGNHVDGLIWVSARGGNQLI